MTRADLARLLRRSLHFDHRAMLVIVSALLIATVASGQPVSGKAG